MKKINFTQASYPEKQIFSENFKSLDKAIERMKSLDYGIIKKSKFGIGSHSIEDPDQRHQNKDLYYNSQNVDGFYFYTIENHIDFYRLLIHKTNKHKMITAAETGDVDKFIKYFNDTDKMKEFSLSTAIINGHWNIVKYLTDNHNLKKKPLWDAIRYNKVEIVKNLLSNGHKLPKDWIAYCLYNDSIDVATELLINRKSHLNFTEDEIKTNWFKNEIIKKSKTADLVRKIVI